MESFYQEHNPFLMDSSSPSSYLYKLEEMSNNASSNLLSCSSDTQTSNSQASMDRKRKLIDCTSLTSTPIKDKVYKKIIWFLVKAVYFKVTLGTTSDFFFSLSVFF
jgi:hypothetical protein